MLSIFLLLPPNFPSTLKATVATASSGLCKVRHRAWGGEGEGGEERGGEGEGEEIYRRESLEGLNTI